MDNENLTRSQVYRTSNITFDDLETLDPKLKEVYIQAKKIAPMNLSVLLLGETGTGKNFLAQAIHMSSKRMLEPFIVVNCAALTDTLLESELFGYEKGAFTGALANKKGKFEIAGTGTLFLDEVSDLSLAAQAKILRAIEYRQYERVGGESTYNTDARFIAASNQDLLSLVKQGLFRRDLYFRLAEFVLKINPLRQRKIDILPLARKIAVESSRKLQLGFKDFTPEAEIWMQNYSWIGNIRQLKNLIRYSLVLSNDGIITLELLKKGDSIVEESETAPELRSLADVEKQHIRKILNFTDGNKSEAARILGITRPTLDKKLR